jgi:hypothetical protein
MAAIMSISATRRRRRELIGPKRGNPVKISIPTLQSGEPQNRTKLTKPLGGKLFQ